MAEPEPRPERIVAENTSEAIWLRFRRLTSSTLCKRAIEERDPSLSPDVAEQKGREVASSVRCALGYWQSQAESLNAKVLARYYAILQVSIAEQVAHPASTTGLADIQRHTERGHGLWSITAPNEEFPLNYMIACRNNGHFFEYCQFRGIDLAPFAMGSRPDSWDKIAEDKRNRLVSLGDLLRRIPELQSIVEETLKVPPLSFPVFYATDLNMPAQREQHRAHTLETGQAVRNVPDMGATTTTYIGIMPSSPKITLDYLHEQQLPLSNLRFVQDDILGGSPYFVGDLVHPREEHWYDILNIHKSGSCGTSTIVPLWGGITDPFIINFAALYALSIVVRYLPQLWHEIENGSMDHVRALIEQYVATIDNVLPKLAIEKITGRKVNVVQPGSIFGPL
jgi:hypothetical protein